MTLIAFLPVLLRLSAGITEVPFLGAIPYPLVTAALLWSVFGTGFLALVGIKLPGLQFRNQRVEAAYRKELVYGEDDPSARRSADRAAAVRQRAQELFPALLPLHVFQRRADLLPADRQHLRLRHPGADHRRRGDHARA